MAAGSPADVASRAWTTACRIGPLAAAVAAGGCRARDGEPDLRMHMAAERPVVAAGDTIRLRVAVTNTGRTPREIGRGCAPGVDVAITTPAGVVRSATADLLNTGGTRGMFICLAGDASVVEPGETDSATFAWRSPVMPGRYRAVAQVFGGDTLLASSAPLLIRVR